jgi:hypothetical protein
MFTVIMSVLMGMGSSIRMGMLVRMLVLMFFAAMAMGGLVGRIAHISFLLLYILAAGVIYQLRYHTTTRRVFKLKDSTAASGKVPYRDAAKVVARSYFH